MTLWDAELFLVLIGQFESEEVSTILYFAKEY